MISSSRWVEFGFGIFQRGSFMFATWIPSAPVSTRGACSPQNSCVDLKCNCPRFAEGKLL